MKSRRTRFSRPVHPLSVIGGVLAATAVSFRASAQEALRSTLSLDQTLATQQNRAVDLGPVQPHIGPVPFSLSVDSGFQFEDNINAAQTNPQADVILHSSLNTSFHWAATDQSEVDLNAGVGYSRYLKYSQNDRVDFAPTSALTWNVLLQDVTLTFYDQFSYTEDVVTQGALSDLATFPVFDNVTGFRASWTPDAWLFQAGYSHDEYFSDLSALNYLNRTSEYFFARGAWRFAENTQAGLEASASITAFEISAQAGNTSISIGPFADWQITEAIRATLRGGPTIYLFDAQPGAGSNSGTRLNSYYAGAQLNQQLTDYLSHQVSVQREVSLGLNEGGNFLTQLTAAYSLTYSQTRFLDIGINAAYERGTQTFQNEIVIAEGLGFLVNQTENYDHYAVGPSFTWHATDKLTASLNYNYYLRDSNLAGRGYQDNTVAFKVDYAF
ncbi:MAG TPA: hypothetical protein VH413_09885 [Verrucomicrobiae bacterium]|nr:hypothetical protein [Verrucomicrobiae bacterium]